MCERERERERVHLRVTRVKTTESLLELLATVATMGVLHDSHVTDGKSVFLVKNCQLAILRQISVDSFEVHTFQDFNSVSWSVGCSEMLRVTSGYGVL